MAVELKVPSVGESVTEVTIGAWLKKEGDTAGLDETIVEIESDKATMELPAPVAGVISRIVKNSGDTANVGEVIGYMEEGSAASNGAGAGEQAAQSKASAPAAGTEQSKQASPPPAAAGQQASSAPARPDAEQNNPAPATPVQTPAASQSAPAAQETKRPTAQQNGGLVTPPPAGPLRVMPAAQREIAERGVDPSNIEPSGPGGRILKEDVLRAAQSPTAVRPPAQAAPYAAEDSEGPGELLAGEEAVPMSPIRRKIAERLVYSQQTAALLTTFNEIDMSAVIELRNRYKDKFAEKHGVKLGFMSFFVKAAIEALKAFPQVNAEIRGSHIIYKNYYDIGIAVGGGKGLVVPVLRSADRMSFSEVELAIADYATRAQQNKLMPEEFTGGTFTISNGGIYGSLMSTPIINPPQVAILGLHKIEKRPVVIDNAIAIRDMMYVAVTYDHRLIDGRESVSFLHRIKDCIEDPARILIEI